MRIVIDLQAAQTPQSRNRGIGRYALSLARAMLRIGTKHEFIVALNGMYEDTVMPVRESLEGFIAQHDIVTWHATIPPRTVGGVRERQADELVRQSFLESLHADFLHVASLFEFGPRSLTGIPAQRPHHRTAVTLYDLIPHVHRQMYMRDDGAAFEYDHKLEELKRADLWLAISESSRREGIDLLGLPGERVVNISADADPHFSPGPVAAELEVALRTQHGLLKPFVMYTGGIDPRKNIEGLIEAWARQPQALRDMHQLAIVCSVQPDERARLEDLVRRLDLVGGEVVFTGFVPEEHLVALYRLCKLFVFPSKHEGFGLPALEAMRCGAPVIGAANSSIPEVIGRDDALFDGNSVDAIAAKLQQVLGDDGLRAELARFAREQAQRFSWERSARVAIDAMEKLGPPPARARRAPPASRPRLAYVSPLPPQRSGIADYSAELIPALARHYEIDLVSDQPEVEPAVLASAGALRDPGWFGEHASEYDRILYHFGNSQFHEFMVPLLQRHPGVVVLHDFFLSGMQAHRELVSGKGPCWSHALYESHGWHALARRAAGGNLEPVIHEFPANFEVLRAAQGVIVHSPFSCRLAREWYGPRGAGRWRVIPHLRVALPSRRGEARAELGLSAADFLVCSFGILGRTKMNDRLLRAWSRSSLAGDPHCRLVFVGENDQGEFGRAMQSALERAGGRVEITGWASPELFRRYLDAADVAVQLRTLSRGETSGTVLDAMNHGVPVVANANGTMAYLPRDAAIVLDEQFTDAQLVSALERLRSDAALREAMGEAGRRAIETRHSPADCAAAYAEAIEDFAQDAARGPVALVRRIATETGNGLPGDVLQALSRAIAHNEPGPAPARQLFIELAAWLPGDTHVPPLLQGLLDSALPGWRAEPVYRGDDGSWRYARHWMLRAAPGGRRLLEDEPVEMRRGDVWALAFASDTVPLEARHEGLQSVLLAPRGDANLAWAAVAASVDSRGAPRCFVDISELVRHDWQSGIQRVVKNYLAELLRRPPPGTVVVPVCGRPGEHGYRAALSFLRDLAGLPRSAGGDPSIEPRAGDTFFALDLQPHITAQNADVLRGFRERGVRLVFMVYDLLPVRLPECFFPGAAEHHERWLRIVADAHEAICISQAVADELKAWVGANVPGAALRDIHCLHLGGDSTAQLATRGLPPNARELLSTLRESPSFLMVGTIEPRKAHAQVLAAFEHLWREGGEARLVISGRPGWMTEHLLQRLRDHPEQGRRLLWISDGSDEYVEALYQSCTALILASRGEGFGLPLVEAAQRGLPIIARDLPVFREVAGDHAFYFQDDAAPALAAKIREWLQLREQGKHPQSRAMPWLTWSQSAARLRRLLGDDQPSV